MLLGQNIRHSLNRDWHTTESRMTDGVFISRIFPVRSLMILVTRLSTRKVLPQYGTSSASKYSPRFLLDVFRVFRISSCDLMRTNSPGCRLRVTSGVGRPSGNDPVLRGNGVPCHKG